MKKRPDIWHPNRDTAESQAISLENLPDATALQRIQATLWGEEETRGAAVMVGAGLSRTAHRAADNAPPPPLWNDLARKMEAHLYLSGSTPRSPLQLAQEYEAALGRNALDDLIRTHINDEALTPGPHHRALVALPWTDILTTNWDTLLERAAAEYPTRNYTPVLTTNDIPRTRAPRIIKLCGTLPSHTPFIVTEEDFRTYPQRYAPFVNLTQQVLMESVLCLIGFSGDDPNFQQWSGWVRDHLGRHAPPIYLIGALNLTQPARRRLEDRGVQPIDLTPLVEKLDREEQHEAALKLFIRALRDAKPWPRQHWPRAAPSESKKATPGPPTIDEWRATREEYPGWVVPPWDARFRIAAETSQQWEKLQPTTNEASPAERHRALYEYTWRLDIALLPLPDDLLEELAAAATEEPATLNPERREQQLSTKEREQLALWLLRHAREQDNQQEFNRWQRWIEQQAPNVTAPACWERCLRARDTLNLAEIEHHLPCIEGNDPIWKLRRAALLAELNRETGAYEEAREALRDLRRRRAQDRGSIWIASRLASALFFCHAATFLQRDKPTQEELGDQHDEPWPSELIRLRCDPWEERRYIDDRLHDALEDARKGPVEIRHSFDPGASTRWVRESPRRPSDAPRQARRLLDQAGIPLGLGMIDLSRHTLDLATRVEGVTTSTEILRMVQTRPPQERTDEHLSPLVVTRLAPATIEAAIPALRQALADALRRYDRVKEEKECWKEQDAWISRAARTAEILSRLLIRATPTTIEETLNEAFLLGHRRITHWLFYEPLGHMIQRGVKALPPEKRAVYVLPVIEFPLPGEHEKEHADRHWPEIIDALGAPVVNRDSEPERWTRRIQDLTTVVRSGKRPQREAAINRLLHLHQWRALEDAEQEAFADALWAQRTGEDGLPSATGIFSHVFLLLPEPAPGLARSTFEQRVIQLPKPTQPMAEDLVALTNAVRHLPEQGQYTLGRQDAATWLERIIEKTAAHASVTDDNPMFSPDEWRRFHEQKGWALATAILPALAPEDVSQCVIDMAFEQDAPHSMLVALPALAALKPDLLDRATARLRQAFTESSAETWRCAAAAILEWSKLAREDAIAAPPPDLVSEIVNAIQGRHQDRLFTALDVAPRLVEEERFSALDRERLDNGLASLLRELDYQHEHVDMYHAGNLIGLLRASCIRLADALHAAGHESDSINGWLAAAERDPLPEVRYALTD